MEPCLSSGSALPSLAESLFNYAVGVAVCKRLSLCVVTEQSVDVEFPLVVRKAALKEVFLAVANEDLRGLQSLAFSRCLTLHFGHALRSK